MMNPNWIGHSKRLALLYWVLWERADPSLERMLDGLFDALADLDTRARVRATQPADATGRPMLFRYPSTSSTAGSCPGAVGAAAVSATRLTGRSQRGPNLPRDVTLATSSRTNGNIIPSALAFTYSGRG
jgi:hypothetical protein